MAFRDVRCLQEHTTLVLPGTCAYLFWQLGMIQYLCEHFDTRGVKLAPRRT